MKTKIRGIILVFAIMVTSIGETVAQEWWTNIEVAKEIASEENKPIILVFQGSDWCAPCIKLEKKIWSSEAFKSYANENYVMLKADFPRKKKNALPEDQSKANALLAERYNKQGYFPFVVVLDSSGKVLGKIGYKKVTPEKYIEELNAFIE